MFPMIAFSEAGRLGFKKGQDQKGTGLKGRITYPPQADTLSDLCC